MHSGKFRLYFTTEANISWSTISKIFTIYTKQITETFISTFIPACLVPVNHSNFCRLIPPALFWNLLFVVGLWKHNRAGSAHHNRRTRPGLSPSGRGASWTAGVFHPTRNRLATGWSSSRRRSRRPRPDPAAADRTRRSSRWASSWTGPQTEPRNNNMLNYHPWSEARIPTISEYFNDPKL